MGAFRRVRCSVLPATVALAIGAGAVVPSANAIRRCLTRSKLTHIDPDNVDPRLALPDTLRVANIRVIRDRVNALNHHQVEVIGALHGIPGRRPACW